LFCHWLFCRVHVDSQLIILKWRVIRNFLASRNLMGRIFRFGNSHCSPFFVDEIFWRLLRVRQCSKNSLNIKVKIYVIFLARSRYCFNYEAKDIGQRSVHIFQDGETHSLQKSPKVWLLHLITMHKHGSWYLLLIYIRLMIGLQIVLLCITWSIDEIFSTIFKRFLKDLCLLKQPRWMVRLMAKETYTSSCHIMDNKIVLFLFMFFTSKDSRNFWFQSSSDY
jgi:hypothetical protein